MVDRFKGMLTTISDTFVNASHLAQTVQELQEKVDTLTKNVDHYTTQIAAYENTIRSLGQERDEARQQLEGERNTNRLITSEYVTLQNEHDALLQQHQSLDGVVQELRHERDDALMEVRRLTDELETLRSKHQAFKDHVEGLWKAINPQPRNETGQFEEYPKAVTG